MIPADFPVQPPLASVPGVQPKLLVVQVGDTYRAPATEDAQDQYARCADLAQQVAKKLRRKVDEGSLPSETAALEGALLTLRKRGWCSDAQNVWIVRRAAHLLGWQAPEAFAMRRSSTP